MSVAENIKRIRIEKGFTQKKLGDLSGINEANIRKYENNRQNPKIETLQKIANALGINVTELLDSSQLQVQANFSGNIFTSSKNMNSEKQDISNIISMIENLGFEYITISEDDKVIICHTHKDMELQEYFYVPLIEINKIIEKYENAKKETIEETIDIYEGLKLNNLNLLLHQYEKELVVQEFLLMNYASKKVKEYREKLKTVTKKEEQIEILKKLFKELEILKITIPSTIKLNDEEI